MGNIVLRNKYVQLLLFLPAIIIWQLIDSWLQKGQIDIRYIIFNSLSWTYVLIVIVLYFANKFNKIVQGLSKISTKDILFNFFFTLGYTLIDSLEKGLSLSLIKILAFIFSTLALSFFVSLFMYLYGLGRTSSQSNK